jgi:hypothetical protein
MAPLGRRLERDHCLEHRQRRRIGAGIGPPRLAEHAIHLRELLDRPVAHLQERLRCADRDAGHRRRHVDQRALRERRHELRSEVREDRHRDGDERDGAADHRPFPPQRPADDWLVEPHEETADEVRLFGPDPADNRRVRDAAEPCWPELEAPHAREEHAQRRVERDHEDCRDEHRERLGVGERCEHPPFLRLERQYREERDSDHEQREEARRRHLLDRLEDDLAMVARRSLALRLLELLVRLLDDHDRCIHQFAHRDRDAPERHDVGRDPHRPERDERYEHGNRNRNEWDHRARQVPQEEQHDQGDGDHDLDERLADVVDGAADQRRPVVDRDNLHSGWHARFNLVDALLDPIDHVNRVLSLAHDDDARHHLAGAVQIGEPPPQIRADRHVADVANPDRRTGIARGHDDALEVGDRLRVAAAAHHVLGAAELD